jgi:hypothetical protein
LERPDPAFGLIQVVHDLIHCLLALAKINNIDQNNLNSMHSSADAKRARTSAQYLGHFDALSSLEECKQLFHRLFCLTTW